MDNRSTTSLASQAGLTAHAEAPAGSRFSESIAGPPHAEQEKQPQDLQGASGDASTPAQQPEQQKVPFYKKRWFIIANAIGIPLGIALLFIILFPVVKAIVQAVVNKSQLQVDVATISNAKNDSFTLGLQGLVTHTGIIPARIEFRQPVQVSWVQDNGTETPIGVMTLDTLHASHKRATVNQTTTFNITDTAAFGVFAGHMITAQNFTWRLTSNSLRVQAAKFPVSNGIKFNKLLTLNGFDSFDGNVLLQDLQLPSDNPAGGINFVAATQLTNPSPFSLDLGTVVFDLSYRNVRLGSGTSNNTKIAPGNNTITLSGFLEAHNSSSELAIVSELFTNYLNGENSDVIATGQSTLQADGTKIAWLSTGLSALSLHVPFRSLAGAISPIQSINIGDMTLRFAEAAPWSPSAESHSITAALSLPFGFGLSIGQIQNEFNITTDGNVVAGLATPLGASQSSIKVMSSTLTSGTIDIAVTNTNLSVPYPSRPAFSTFNANLTSLDAANFHLVGRSHAIANTSIGQLTLDPINFNVSSGLMGLKGLDGLISLNSVDVQGGTTRGITLGIDVSIINPSNLNLSVGDLNVRLFRDGSSIGTALMPNLTLNMGVNNVKASSVFEANANPQGLQTLDDFVGKKDVGLSISGFDGSTGVASLVQAFKTLNVGVTLPALKTDLLDIAALQVLPTTGRENNISHVTVSLANPFSTDLHITRIQSTVKAFGVSLGTIDTATDFMSKANTTTDSPNLELNMNLDPSSIFTVTRALAVEAGLNTEQLDSIVQLGGYQYLFTTGPEVSTNQRRDNIFTGFDLPTFIQKAFTQLKLDVDLTTEVTIGEYTTTLKYTQSSLPTKTDDSLNFILPVLAQPVVQKIVGGSDLGVSTVLITGPQQESFGTTLNGSITNAGPFDAKISFPEGATVVWSGQPIGNIRLQDINITGDVGAQFTADSQFQVADVAHLTDFTKTLLTEESFDWDISANNLNVGALGIVVDGITLPSKRVSLKGFNGLKGGVKVQTFSLPSNDPNGGITLNLAASTTNPSQVGIELSSLAFDTFASDVMIAPVSTNNTVMLSPQSTTMLSLNGRLIPQSSDEDLSVVSSIFNNFIHGQDSDVSVHGAAAGPNDVTWLNDGIKALQVDTVLPNQGPQSLIQAISLNQLTLDFTEDTAYNPSTSSDSTDASFQLPGGFDFPIDITALQQTIETSFNGQNFAQLAIPKGPSTTDLENHIIHLGFSNVPFAVADDQHETFNQFLAATTIGQNQTLGLSGTANADASTAIGVISLENITFSVQSTIQGLHGLSERPITVSDLDVNHGFPDFLLIKVNTALFNPSNLTIGTGDVAFSLQFQNSMIGEADLSDMVIKPGNQSYATDVHYAPTGDAVSAGRALLENFLQGIDVDTTISGSMDSTPIQSLRLALSQIVLSPVTIPALHQSLIKSVSIQFPTDIVSTGAAQSSFVLDNPFTAAINLLRVGASATFHNLTLGSIDNVDVTSNPIHADGHSDVTSSVLPLKFNLDPSTIIQLLTIGAQNNNGDLGSLADLFQFVLGNPNFQPPVITQVDTNQPTCVSGHQFDFNSAILNSLKNLEVELAVDSSVKLDDFATDLSFAQHDVPVTTDDTALFLVGAVAGPIAQHLVDQAELTFSRAIIRNISDEGFDLALQGSLTGTGPLDALIEFTEPVIVNWQGNDIATIELPPICAAADDGVPDYSTDAHLTITDNSKFTDFAVFLLHSPSFEWIISTDKLRLTALGTIFDNITLQKSISFKAFNGLPGVTISNFKLPSDDPAGGIHIETDSTIPSPAELGIDLGIVTFTAQFENTVLGPLSTTTSLTLAPNSVTSTHLAGRIVPQSGSDLEAVGTLFSRFLAADNQTLAVIGESVQPTDSSDPVGWLTTAIKSLTLSVTLPGESFNIIQSISLGDLDVVLQTPDEAFAPPTNSKATSAVYRNPFGFSLQVVQAGENIVLGNGDVDIAELDLPKIAANGGVSTGNDADLQLSWSNQPLKALNNDAFSAMLAAVTLQDGLDLTLRGSADVTARTTVGDIPISGIPFNVQSSLKGINNFGGVAKLSNVSVTGSGGNGGNEFVVSPLDTELENPSNVSLHTVDIALPVVFKGTMIGRAAIDPFDLTSGDQAIPTEFRYEPENANDTTAQSFLTDFLTSTDDLPLTIQGDSSSSPIPSLQEALSGVHLTTSLTGMGQSLLKHINVEITLQSLIDNFVTIDFDIFNPLGTELEIRFVQSDAEVNGTTFAHFDQPFNSFVVPPGQTVNSGDVPNVLLVQGALNSLGIIPLGMLDVFNAVTAQIGEGGYTIPWLQLVQFGVPTEYHLSLVGLEVPLSEFKAKAMSMSAASAARTVSTRLSASSGAVSASVTSAASESTGSTSRSAGPSSSAASARIPAASASGSSSGASDSEAANTPAATISDSSSPALIPESSATPEQKAKSPPTATAQGSAAASSSTASHDDSSNSNPLSILSL